MEKIIREVEIISNCVQSDPKTLQFEVTKLDPFNNWENIDYEHSI